jgi:hypothetical protein
MANKRRKKAPPGVAKSSTPVRANVQLSLLEIARGYDGLFRGEPDPVLVFALFGAGRLLCREQIAFTKRGEAESTMVPAKPHLARIGLPLAYASLGLLCVAIEEDSGESVQSMYAAFERPVRVWRPGDAMPQPQEPDDLEWLHAGGLPQPVELVLDGAEWRAALHGDKLIAASLASFAPRRASHELRMPFCSPDGKNEWTARLSVALV